MAKILLREYYELCEGGVCQDLLTEDEKRFVTDGGMMLSGKLQEADCQNGNGRVYPFQTLMREVKTYQKLVKENRALGELDHPDDSVINLRNCSHMVTSVWMEEKNVMGKIKVLDTPSGKILRSLVESGVKLGISSRGMGSVSEGNGSTMVEDDFQLICFDFRAWYDTVARDERLKTVPWYADIIKMIGSGLLTQRYLRAVPLHMGDAFWPNVASGVRAAVEILDISLDAVQSTLQKDDGGKAFFEYVKDHIAPIDAELAKKLRHEIDYSEELGGLVVKSMIGQYEELFDTRGAIEKRAPRAAGGLRGKLKPKDIKRLAPIKGTLKPPPKPPKLDFTKPPPPPKKKK